MPIKTRFLFVPIILIALLIFVVGAFGYREYRRHERELAAKKVVQAEKIKVTFIEGWTVDEMGAALEKQGVLSKEKLKADLKAFNLSSYPIIKSTKPATAGFEGYLFPDTYFFTKQSSSAEVISKILENFEERARSIGLKEGGDLKYTNGLTAYQILTLASIVEQESGGKGISQAELDDQRATIAGIFYNRLAKGQALESDATINYVTGNNHAAATSADLQINSPYNTYKYAGLPPGPICNPSLASIKAVLNPKKTDYYYFLHVQPSGQVLYSKTFEEHVKKKNQNR